MAAAEAKAVELRAALEKAEADKALAVKDREQAYESLSRTAVALQEHKVCRCVVFGVPLLYCHFLLTHTRQCILI